MNPDTLAAAAVRGDLAAVRTLLDAGADVNARTAGGSTALITATLWNRFDIVCLLLARGANPSVADADGWTAVDIARHRRYADLVLLIEEAKESL